VTKCKRLKLHAGCDVTSHHQQTLESVTPFPLNRTVTLEWCVEQCVVAWR